MTAVDLSTTDLSTSDLSTSDAAHLPAQALPQQLSERRTTTSTPESRDRRSAELTESLADALRRGDHDAERQVRDDLVVTNMPVADALATRYRLRGEADDDLQQVAYLGLIQAARRYDPERQTSFVGFCVPTVLGEIKRHFRDRGWMVRPPRRVQELQLRVFRVRNELSAELGRPPTLEELADRTECAPADVSEALAVRSCYSPTPLDRPVGESPESQTIADLLPADNTEVGPAEARVMLGPIVARLADRDRRILRLRFFDGLTQREIARDIGVTQMQVSRVLSRIFGELRTSLGEQ